MKRLFIPLFLVALVVSSCAQPVRPTTGADQLDVLLAMITGKRVALMVNQTAVVGRTHLVDTLRSRGVNIIKIFSPEHGFRGTADAGEKVLDGIDAKTGVPVVSLYGTNKKATPEQMKDVDIVVFDIQDVGVRFFTYISSLHYLMEACAENNKKVIVLDRPNPNGSYVDGPILEPEQKSFVGMHPIPIVHGLTMGEYAQMINGEGWLEGGRTCELAVVHLLGWKHADSYSLPIPPSPNLPNDHAIALYPSTCLFEGTSFSVGRGTLNPFELVGHPDMKDLAFTFTPVSIDGMAKEPKLQNVECFGLDLRSEKPGQQVSLKHLIAMYQAFPEKEKFFISYFDKLAGNTMLKEQIKAGLTEEEIRNSWKPELSKYLTMREKYLLYP